MENADARRDKGAPACRSHGGVRSSGAGGLRVERRCRSGLSPRNDRYHETVVNRGTTTVVVKYGAPIVDINHIAEHHAPVDDPDHVFAGRVHSANSAISFSRR